MIVQPPYQLEGWTKVREFPKGSSGSVSLLSMTEDEMKKAAKRKRKTAFGFAPSTKKKA